MKLRNHHRRLPRSAGVLLHVTSLPGGHGIGDLGPAAFDWVDALADAHQHWWQILPLNPAGQGFSPYNSFSAFAGNPLLISLDRLVDVGLLRPAEVRLPPGGFSRERVDYPAVERFKTDRLRLAFARFKEKAPAGMSRRFDQFVQRSADWLEDFTLFMALREHHTAAAWTQWPKPLVSRDPAALAAARAELAGPIRCQQFLQFLFYEQLKALRAHAAERRVKIIGDLPIFVAGESADVWANPQLFLLDRDRRPKVVAGVPPDYFSETGQRWGNPMYCWSAVQKENFGWWLRRFRNLLAQVDLIRIDHFRGFAGCWHIPAAAADARGGKWVKSPGVALFQTLQKELGALPFIAEDLGVITPDVAALRDSLHLPGMRVLQFAFGDTAANPFLPHNYVHNAVAYTGTHDNDTTPGWFTSLNPKLRKAVLNYLPDAAQDVSWALIHAIWSSVADVAIVPVQDLLELGSDARMNTPGTGEGNWAWRLNDARRLKPALRRLAELTTTYARTV